MPLINSKTRQVYIKYSAKDLENIANYMRGVNLVSLNCAGSGHSGGTLSIMDIAAVLYLSIARHDPKNPSWSERDRIVWSGGHKAPALYVSLGISGYFPIEDVARLRKFDSPYQGHPHWLKLKGVEVSTGSLGQGLGLAVGMALSAKLKKEKHKVYVITGDGEWDEGSMWESAMEAAHYKLDNLIVIVDKNQLQIDGKTKDVMNLDPLEKKFTSFGFHVININGHDIDEIQTAFKNAVKVEGKPVLILARTVKGKGVSFMENMASWHGKSPNDGELDKALKELGLDGKINVTKYKNIARVHQERINLLISKKIPRFGKDYFWNKQEIMKVDMQPTRFGFGNALESEGDNPKVVCLGLDISTSVTISKFYEKFPNRKSRFLSMGIAEQSATTVAGGLAREGFLPVLSTYGVFCSQRNADQMRTSICYGNLNVMFGGAHGGVSVGADGATHQALEEINVVGVLPNMHLEVPCDVVETEKATRYLLLKLKGPKYIRFAREATPVVTDKKTPYVFGKANVIRLRKLQKNFIEAFDIKLANKYKNENEDLTIIACGPQVPEAMRTAWILKEKYNLETRVINMHTLKPLDKEAIKAAVIQTKAIITAEEHQKGGLSGLVSAVILEANLGKTVKFGSIGVKDRFGDSGEPWELLHEFELSAEFITQKAIQLLKLK